MLLQLLSLDPYFLFILIVQFVPNMREKRLKVNEIGSRARAWAS